MKFLDDLRRECMRRKDRVLIIALSQPIGIPTIFAPIPFVLLFLEAMFREIIFLYSGIAITLLASVVAYRKAVYLGIEMDIFSLHSADNLCKTGGVNIRIRSSVMRRMIKGQHAAQYGFAYCALPTTPYELMLTKELIDTYLGVLTYLNKKFRFQ